MGKGGERGNCSRPFPSSILDTSSSPQDFFWTRPNSLSVSTSNMAGEHLCHCSHCKVHLVCRLCICLVIIEERGKGSGGGSLRASSPIMASKASRKHSRLFSRVVLV